MADNFWEHIDRYRMLGFDPAKWIAGCSNELDPHIFADALQDVKKSTVKLTSSWFDSYNYIDGKNPELTRRVFRLKDSLMDKEVEVKRALVMLRVYAGLGEAARPMSEMLQEFFKPFAAKVTATCTSAVLTEHEDAQFALFDYIELHRGDKVGYMPAVAAATQATDVTRDPDADIHSNIAMTAAIDLLNLLGCGVSSTFKIFPVYDAPEDAILDRIRSNLDVFTSRYNLAMEDYSSLKNGKLFYGTTAMATTTKELPTRYDLTEEGMEVFVSNKFGGLPALSLYTLARMNSDNIIKYETAGVSFESIVRARDEALKNLAEPHFVLGKLVAKFLPDYGTPYDKSSHITAVYPVGARGIFALGQLAELCNCQLSIDEIPMRNEAIEKYAAKEHLVENSTASLNGCHLFIASKEVAALVIEDLRKHNFTPERIGSVSKKGVASVSFGSGRNMDDYVPSRAKLERLVAAPAQQPAPGAH